jgi:hypothetical protein
MSFHQTYEFQAIDRPLTAAELAEVRRISSRATVTPTRFAVSYDWGDLKASPHDMLRRWYDVHLYRSSNGASFALKVPAGLLDAATLDDFACEEVLTGKSASEHRILTWTLEDDDGGGWIDDADVASEFDDLIGIRAALLRGDLRPLYVGWLAGVDQLDDDDLEPPVPPGLCAADDPSSALARFLGVDADLLAAAAEASPAVNKRREAERARAWVESLPTNEKDAAIASWLGYGGPEAQVALQQRHGLWLRASAQGGKAAERRTVGALRDRAEALCESRQKAEAERTARARIAHLEAVATRSGAMWTDLARLRENHSQSARRQVIALLEDLRDAAQHAGTGSAFDAKLAAFVAEIGPTRALYQELKAKKFIR